MPEHLNRADFEKLDAEDPLAAFRDAFALPEGLIYLDGNSLGALPKETAGRVNDLIERQWGQDLIRSWNENNWMDLPFRVGANIARITGAHSHEVIACDITTINIFKLLTGALSLRPGRRVILAEKRDFPTNLYIAQGVDKLLGARAELKLVDRQALAESIDDSVAVVLSTHVSYRQSHMHHMATVTKKAHDAGALMCWDLCHSAGAVPVDLNACGVDLAVGCGYKYLNGGPGAPAFLYIAERHQDQIEPYLSGWLGHAAPFDFVDSYKPAPGIRRMLAGTPPVIGLTALEVGTEIFTRTDMQTVRAKSVKQGELFLRLIEERLSAHGFRLACPEDAAERGSQVTIAHDEGYAIMQALIDRQVIGDFRAPDIVRFGFTPLYVRYTDIWDAVEVLVDIMENRAWDTPDYRARKAVT